MRQSIRTFVELCIETLPIDEPLYEFGSYQVDDQNDDLRPLFQNKDYIGCDMRPGPGVDCVLDLHDIDLADNVAGIGRDT